jgi:hypothetical protein
MDVVLKTERERKRAGKYSLHTTGTCCLPMWVLLSRCHAGSHSRLFCLPSPATNTKIYKTIITVVCMDVKSDRSP